MDSNTSPRKAVQKFYGNRLRVRTCGLIERQGKLLLLKHDLGAGDLWLPPGGGIEPGESAFECLKREIKEETGLVAESCDFLFACEFINESLHSIELFFKVKVTGELVIGGDNEKGAPKVILGGRFLTWMEISSLPKRNLHGIFKRINEPSEILELKGYFTL